MNDPLPTKRDFLDYHGCLDAQSAWNNFGGLSVDAAYAKFCENPLRYQEDFMFMGRIAFIYYFPVLERFVRDGIDTGEEEAWDEFWIIAEGILTQLDSGKSWFKSAGCLEKIHSLSDFVLISTCSNTAKKPSMGSHLAKIESSWRKVHRLTTPT